MAGFEILAVLELLGLLALSSMACLPRCDDDLPLVVNNARLDALLAIGIASLEQMRQIQDDTWLGVSTASDDEIDDSVLANLHLPTPTESTLGGVNPPGDFPPPTAMWGLIASPCTSGAADAQRDDSGHTMLERAVQDDTDDFHMWCIGDLPDALADDHLIVRLLDTTNLRCIAVGGERTATPGRDGHSVRFLDASGTARLDGLAGRCVVDLGAGVQAHIFPLRGDCICWSADGIPECLEDGIVTGDLQQDAPATSGRDQDPIEATPAMPDRADVVISPTMPMHKVSDDGSKRRRLGRGTFGKACPSGALLASQQLLEHAHGKFGWFRACSKRGSGCNFTRDLSPAGFAKLPASARESEGSAQPARTFFRVHAPSVLVGGRAVASGCRGV